MPRAKVKKTTTYVPTTPAPYYPTKADIRRWTELLNWLVFDGKCPKWRNINIRPIKMLAWCTPVYTKRGKRVCDLDVRLKYESFQGFYAVLIHEMCHAAEWVELETMSHGRYFYSRKEMLSTHGIKLQHRY